MQAMIDRDEDSLLMAIAGMMHCLCFVNVMTPTGCPL